MIMMTTVLLLSLDIGDWIGLSVILLFFLTVSILILVNSVRNHRIRKKNEQAYREKYCRTVAFTDPMLFGEIEAELDTLSGILKAENIRMPEFGAQMPNAILVEGYTDADHETVLRQLHTAYANQQNILLHMAEEMRHLLGADEETELSADSELAEQIMVTDFQFSHTQDALVMLIVAGAEYHNDTYSLSALYDPDSMRWEYEAEKIGYPEEREDGCGETAVS